MKNIMLKLVSSKDENPFRQFPELKNIWLPELAVLAEEAIDESFEHQNKNPTEDIGEIYLVYEKNKTGNKLMGLSGFFPINELPGEFFLRWHGLFDEYKGKGHSREIINFIVDYIKNNYDNTKTFTEFMPVIPEYESTSKYFEELGFKKVGKPEVVKWSNYLWQNYVLNIEKLTNQNSLKY